MTNKGFDSTSLRIILICIMVIMIGGLVGGYYYAQDWLITYAKDVNKTSSQLAEKEVGQVQAESVSELSRLKPVIDKSANFASTSSTYLNIVTTDINKYASATGIEVTEISPTQFTATQTSPAMAGLQTQYVRVSFKNPVISTNLIKFLKAIETNIPKMRVTGISVTRESDDSNKLSIDPLTLEVYTR